VKSEKWMEAEAKAEAKAEVKFEAKAEVEVEVEMLINRKKGINPANHAENQMDWVNKN
jgi:hypothetical protein